MLCEAGVEEIYDRNIQAVQPDYRRSAGIAVIVKSPRGRENQVARMHGYALAIHGGVSAFAFNDETQCASHMAMTICELTGQYQLQTGVNALRDARSAWVTGIFQHQDPALCFARRDQL